jgi:hypothetical protein
LICARRLFCVSLILFCSAAVSFAAAQGGAFDDIPVGARACGMGGAYTAVCDDASGIYWNPSALGRMLRSELTTSNEDLFSLGLINYSFAGLAYHGLGKGTMGFGWARLGTSQSSSLSNYTENTYIVSYGQSISRYAYAGMSLKYFSVDFTNKAAGYGADAAISYDVIPRRLSFALDWQNLNKPEIRWDTGAVDSLDSVIHLGAAVKIGNNSTFSVEGTERYGQQAEGSFGWESLLFSKLIAVRFGAAELNSVLNPSAGIGVYYRRFKFDCAMTGDNDLGQSILLSLSYLY